MITKAKMVRLANRVLSLLGAFPPEAGRKRKEVCPLCHWPTDENPFDQEVKL